MNKVVGLVLLAVGIVLLAFGINSTTKIAEKTVEAVSGKFTDPTMVYIIGGIACVVAGGVITYRYWD